MVHRIALLCGLACSFAVSCLQADVVLQDETITEDLVIAIDERLDLYGTINFDSAKIDLYGLAYSRGPSVNLTGQGSVVLHRTSGDWYSSGSTTSTTVGAGIEILGERDAFFSGHINNYGVIAAVEGGSFASGAYFTLPYSSSSGIVMRNYNVMEARSGGNLALRVDGLDNQGVLRAHPNGRLRLDGRGSTVSIATLGTIENLGGTIELDFHLNNAGQVLNVTGGKWVLPANDRTSIKGGTIATDSETQLVIEPVSIGFNTYGTTLLDGVTINGNVRSEFRSLTRVVNDLVLNGTWQSSMSNSLTLSADSELLGNGTFEFVDGSYSGLVRFEAEHAVIPANYTIRAVDGGMGVIGYAGTSTNSTLAIHAPIEIDAGTFSPGVNSQTNLHAPIEIKNGGTLNVGTNAVGQSPRIINNSSITAETNGFVSLLRYQTFVNNGSVAVTGGRLLVDGTIENNGSITATGSRVDIGNYAMTGNGNFSIDNSTVVVAASMTLAKFLSTPSTNSDFAINSNLNLDGQTLMLADATGQRWQWWGGRVTNGTINTADGSKLVLSGYGLLDHATVNADVQVVPGARLAINGGVEGTGKWILDGGEIYLGDGPNAVETVFTPGVVDFITPNAGTVRIRSKIDNQDSTLVLPAGNEPGSVKWILETRSTDGIVGGRVETAPSTELQVVGSTTTLPQTAQLRGVTLAGDMRVMKARSTSITVRDGFHLDDAIVRIGDSLPNQFSAAMTFVGGQVVDGTGEFHFSDPNAQSGNAYISLIQFSTATGQVAGPVAMGSGITIRTADGSGKLGGNFFSSSPLPVINHGTWIAENGHTLEVDIAELDQQGTLRSEEDSEIVFLKNGSNAGQWQLAGGIFDLKGTTQINEPSGRVSGSGTIEATTGKFVNQGTVSPGPGVGTIEFLTDFQQTESGVLQMTIGGLSAGTTHDQLLATNMQLGGELALGLVDGFEPELGDRFTLINASGQISGEFDLVSSLLAPLSTGLRWDVEYSANSVVLAVLEQIAGDFDNDGDLDGRDFLAWQRNPGVGDLVDWQTSYGGQFAGIANVPEPTSLVLVLFGFMASIRCRSTCFRRHATDDC